MGTVGIMMRARGHQPKHLRQKIDGPRHDLEALTQVLDHHERLNRQARRALERVTGKKKRKVA
jgi:hypothetical protein